MSIICGENSLTSPMTEHIICINNLDINDLDKL